MKGPFDAMIESANIQSETSIAQSKATGKSLLVRPPDGKVLERLRLFIEERNLPIQGSAILTDEESEENSGKVKSKS
jgi:hypothetical protein